VRRADARSRENRRCAGVSFFFQVIEYQVEPSVLNRRLNLFSKDCWRAALADEPEPIGPQVPGVLDAPVPPGIGERLAGARAGPDRHIVGPPCEAEGIGPAADARKEVPLRVVPQVIGLDGTDVPPVDAPPWYVPISGKLLEPRAAETVEFVVVGIAHLYPPWFTFRSFPRTSASSTSRFQADLSLAV
jgi:hypothetical protein